MGYTRDFLIQLQGMKKVHDFNRSSIIRKARENMPSSPEDANDPLLDNDKKFQKEVLEAIAEHLTYLYKPDPFGRESLPAYQSKKQLFSYLYEYLNEYDWDPISGQSQKSFDEVLAEKVEELLENPVIDTPRWPPLSFQNVFNFFTSKLASIGQNHRNANTDTRPLKSKDNDPESKKNR